MATRTPRKTTATKQAPAKDTTAANTAKKTAARKTTTTAAKKTTARKTTEAAKSRQTSSGKGATVTQLPTRKQLPVRPAPAMEGDYTAREMREARATFDAAYLGLPVSPRSWTTQPGGEVTATLPDGGTLRHVPREDGARPGCFLAAIPCPTGARHEVLVANLAELNAVRAALNACTDQHAADSDDAHDVHQAITEGVRPVPAPLAPVGVMKLQDGLVRAKKATDATQPMNTAAIADGLTTRAADHEKPRQHPEDTDD